MMGDGRTLASLSRTMDAKAFSSLVPRLSSLAVLLLGLLFLSACGTANSQAPFDADAQKHAADWMPQGHRAAVQNTGTAACQECHGEDLSGGIAKVSCTRCHLGGALSVHPAAWEGSAILTLHGQYVVANGSDSCKNTVCHGDTLRGVSGPACNSCHSFPGLPDPR